MSPVIHLPMIKELTSRLKQLRADLDRESAQRATIQSGEEYKNLQVQIEELTAKQKQLLSGVCDSTEAYDDAKTELIEEFRKQKLDEFDGVIAKKRISHTVDTNKFLEALDGDVGTFLEFSKITQKSLKEFAALDSNKAIKKSLYDCIIESGEKIVDFDFNYKKEEHLGNVKSIIRGEIQPKSTYDLETILPF